jgi:hypothetical protein
MNRRLIHERGIRFINRHYSPTGQSKPVLKQRGSGSTGATCPFAATNAVLGDADGEKLAARRRQRQQSAPMQNAAVEVGRCPPIHPLPLKAGDSLAEASSSTLAPFEQVELAVIDFGVLADCGKLQCLFCVLDVASCFIYLHAVTPPHASGSR